MSSRVKAIASIWTLSLLAGCTQSRYEPIVYTDSKPAKRWTYTPFEVKYMASQSPALNFEQTLETSAWQCGREADMGYALYSHFRRYGSSKRPDDREQALEDCQRYARKRGNEAITRLRQANVSAKVSELSKDLYAKWSVYLSGMTITAPKDQLAANQYETSRQALMAEEKFAQPPHLGKR